MEEWHKVGEQYAYQGWRKILVKKYRLPNGNQAEFDVVVNNSWVSVAAFTEDNEVILVQQFRPGPEKILVSFCEGYIEKGETPEEAAQRELLEETGYQAQEIIFLKELRSAYSTERRLCLVATGCKKIGKQQLDSSEFIEVFKVSLTKFRSLLKASDQANFSGVDCGYLALDYLNLL